MAVALGFGLVFTFTLGALNGALSDSLSRLHTLQGMALVAVAGACAVGVYCLARSAPNRLTRSLVEGLPLALATLALATVLVKEFKAGGSLRRVVYALALVALVAALLCVLRSQRARRTGLALLVAVAAGAPLAALGVDQFSQRPPPSTEHSGAESSVFLLTIDTLRADALSCYNTSAQPTPHIDALARDGILFEEAFVPAPWTAPSLASMMTALPPEVHAVDEGTSLSAAYATIADRLREAGFKTGAIGKNPFLRQCDLGRGFARVSFYPKAWLEGSMGARLAGRLLPVSMRCNPNSSELTELATRWIKRHGGEPAFFWLHYFDPHIPYRPPQHFWPTGDAPERIGFDFDGMRKIRQGVFVPTPAERRWIRALYDAEVRYVDDEIGKFLAVLKDRGLYDDAVIVLTSDHGEEFWEHGGFEHGHTLYNELLRVPLIVKLSENSSGPAGGRVETPVSILSIMPTILELCGVEEPSASSRSLVHRWDAQGDPATHNPPLFSSGALYYEERQAVRFDGIKYIASSLSQTEEVYDLSADPGEQYSIAGARTELVGRARELLASHRSACVALRDRLGGGSVPGTELDPATERALRSLGYMD